MQCTAGELLRGCHRFKGVNQTVAELVVTTRRPKIIRDAPFHEHLIKGGGREVGMHRLHQRCDTRHMGGRHRRSLVAPVAIGQRSVAITANSAQDTIGKTIRIVVLTHVTAGRSHVDHGAKI